MADLDDVLNNLLGELDDLTMQLEGQPSSRSAPPPPPPLSKPYVEAPSASFPPPPPPPANMVASNVSNSSFPPPPPPPAAMKANVTEEDSMFLPPPPIEVTTAAQDQEDLTAMLDDLASFTDDLSQDKSTISALPQNGKVHLPIENSQQFGTIRRTGASYVQPGYGEDDGGDMTLESLAKDIAISKEEVSMPSEADLANLSPVMNDLDVLAASLSSKTASEKCDNNSQLNNNLSTSAKELSKTMLNKPPTPPAGGLPPALPPKPDKLSFRKPSIRAASNDNLQYLSQDSLSTASSTGSRSLRSSSIITDSTVSSATASMQELPQQGSATDPSQAMTPALHQQPRSVTFALNIEPCTKEPDSMSVPSVDSGVESTISTVEAMTPEEREEKLKSERMRIALEKLKEARIQKLVVKVYNEDQSSKTLMIDERMTTRGIVNQLLEKNHFDFSPDWTLMEEFPSLYMERMFEEHEKPCDFLSYWTRDSTNQLRLLERKDKYALFKTPQRYLLPLSDAQDRMQERQKQSLIEEFFSGGGTSSLVPEVQGWLYIKGDSKSWSRKYCILRSSGLYVSKNGEPKKGKKVSDLTCLVMFEHTQLYHGRGWKKKFKSPFDYGFALKHPSIQVKSKQIKYLCCEDFSTYMTWTVGIRLAKNGKVLLENYQKTQEDLKSTSVVTSHLAMRQQQQEAESQARKMSQDTDSVSSRSSSNPTRPMGVKSIFEGAWQRAEEGEDTVNTRPPTTREKSVYNPSAANSTNNWWSLKSEHEGLPFTDSPQQPAAADPYIPPAPPVSLSYQQPPQDSFDMPLPPPSFQEESYSGFQNDLPPPPDAMFNSSNNNNRVNSRKSRKNNSNSNNNRISPEIAPPSFQPPPPPKKRSSMKKLGGKDQLKQCGGVMSPLTSYYSNSKPNESFKIDDFPPPPPFLLDLKDSFREASKMKTRFNEELLIKNLPPPPNAVLSVISGRQVGRKAPPPPQRSSTTKLSFSGKHGSK